MSALNSSARVCERVVLWGILAAPPASDELRSGPDPILLGEQPSRALLLWESGPEADDGIFTAMHGARI